jgi:hypothetical protein
VVVNGAVDLGVNVGKLTLGVGMLLIPGDDLGILILLIPGPPLLGPIPGSVPGPPGPVPGPPGPVPGPIPGPPGPVPGPIPGPFAVFKEFIPVVVLLSVPLTPDVNCFHNVSKKLASDAPISKG